MSFNDKSFFLWACVMFSIVLLFGVNIYAGLRAEQAWEYGYISGYGEAKADLPSRYSYIILMNREEPTHD